MFNLFSGIYFYGLHHPLLFILLLERESFFYGPIPSGQYGIGAAKMLLGLAVGKIGQPKYL